MSKNQGRRITIRFNPVEEAELELLKKTYGLDADSEALKMAVSWVNHFVGNVTKTFFPSNYDVMLVRKRKSGEVDRKVY